MRNRQQVAQELTQPGAQQLLHDGLLARLAYNGCDGFPRVIPIGFVWNGTSVVVCTVPVSPKVKAISSRPNVALTIDTGSTPAEAKALLLRGVATVETVDGVPDEYLAAAAKSMDEAHLADFRSQVSSMYASMTRISVEPDWARFYDFGAGRMPQFLVDLAQQSQSPDMSSGRS